jgi:hypothetical protein
MKKFIAFLVLLFSFSVSAALFPARGAGITISPPKFEFNADPGQTITGIIKITNQDDAALNLAHDVQDFIAGSETGQPSFTSNATNAGASLKKWITVNEGKNLTVPAQKTAEVPFKITLPKDAEPGGHFGAIFFSPPAGVGQVAITQKIGALVLIRVSGNIEEKGRLDTFGAYNQDPAKINTPEPLENLKPRSFFESAPVPFVIRFENQGNVHIKPEGKIELYRWGSLQKEVGAQNILNEAGVPIRQEIVDFIPINDAQGNVLPNSFRRFDTLFQGTAYWYYKEDGTKEVRYKSFPLGYYTAKMILNYGKEKSQTLTAEVTFLIFPWKIALLILVGTAVLFFGLRKYRRWSRARLKKALLAEIEKQKRD